MSYQEYVIAFHAANQFVSIVVIGGIKRNQSSFCVDSAKIIRINKNK
jgi:hypothetical protein